MTSLLRVAALVLVVASFAVVVAMAVFTLVRAASEIREPPAQSLHTSAVLVVAAVLVGSAAAAVLGMT